MSTGRLGRAFVFVAVVFVATTCVPVQARAEGAAPPTTSDQVTKKLDRILERLEGLDRRIDKLERQLALEPKAPAGHSFDWERLCDCINRLLGLHFFNVYSSDPNQRIERLLNQSERGGPIDAGWKRFWSTNKPSHLNFERIHGGIQ